MKYWVHIFMKWIKLEFGDKKWYRIEILKSTHSIKHMSNVKDLLDYSEAIVFSSSIYASNTTINL